MQTNFNSVELSFLTRLVIFRERYGNAFKKKDKLNIHKKICYIYVYMYITRPPLHRTALESPALATYSVLSTSKATTAVQPASTRCSSRLHTKVMPSGSILEAGSLLR